MFAYVKFMPDFYYRSHFSGHPVYIVCTLGAAFCQPFIKLMMMMMMMMMMTVVMVMMMVMMMVMVVMVVVVLVVVVG